MNLKENGSQSEKSWRYVHCEMDEPERREFERMMGSDEILRREVEHLRQLNSCLGEMIPLTERTEETLVDQILQEWECSSVQEPSNAWIKVWISISDGFRHLIEEWQWRPYAIRSFATVAVTVLLVVGLRAYLAGPLEWMQPEIFLEFQYRGEGEPKSASGYTREEILELHKTLRESVEKHYAEIKGGEHTWRWWRDRKRHLATRYQELPGGGSQVQVILYPSRHEPSVKEWSCYYPDFHSFRNEVDGLSEQIVKELIAGEPEKE